MKRKNLGIPEDIHRAYKLHAAAHNTTICRVGRQSPSSICGEQRYHHAPEIEGGMTKTETTPDDAEQVCRDLPVMMNRCMRVGLFATGQLMHEVVRKAGWELADIKADEKKIAVRRQYAKNR